MDRTVVIAININALINYAICISFETPTGERLKRVPFLCLSGSFKHSDIMSIYVTTDLLLACPVDIDVGS